MALSSLTAGSKTLDSRSTVRFGTSQNGSNVTINGIVDGSSSMVQFTVYLDPQCFSIALNRDASQVVITMNGQANQKPTNVVYTVDTGVNLKTALANATALTVSVVPTGGGSTSTYTFTKSTGGGLGVHA